MNFKTLFRVIPRIIICSTLAVPIIAVADEDFLNGRAAVSEGDYSSAVDFLRKAVVEDSLNTESWRLLGFSYKMLDSLNSAVYAYERVLDIQGEDYDARLALGLLYAWNGRTDESLKMYDSILQDDSTDVEARLGKAKSLSWQNKLREAEAEYETALRLLDDYPPALLGLGETLTWQDRTAEASEAYNRLLAIDSTYSEAWIGLGRAAYWANQPYKAKDYLKKAAEYDPANPVVSRAVSEIDENLRMDLQPKYSYWREDDGGLLTEHEEMSMGADQRVSDMFGLFGRVKAYSSFREGVFEYRRQIGAGADIYPLPSTSIRVELEVDALTGETDAAAVRTDFKGRNKWSWLKWSLVVERRLYEIWSNTKSAGGWGEMSLNPLRRLTLTAGYGYWRLSDENEKNIRFSRLSYEILRRPKLELSLRSRYWDFKREVAGYYTPQDLTQNEAGLQFSWDLGGSAQLAGSAFYSLDSDDAKSVWFDGSIGFRLLENLNLSSAVSYYESEFDYEMFLWKLSLTFKR